MNDKNQNLAILPPELRAKVEQWDAESYPAQQLKALQDLKAEFGKLSAYLTTSSSEDNKADQQVVDTVKMMLKSLDLFDNKKALDNEFATPVVEALNKLQSSLVEAVKAIEVKSEAPIVNVKAPDVHMPDIAAPVVHVDAPSVTMDLTGIQKVLKSDIPKAFNDAIANIPETPVADMSGIESVLSELGAKMDEINIGVRLKPQAPSTLKVTNLDGTAITSFTNSSGVPTSVGLDANGNVPTITTNARKKFRDGFAIAGAQPNPAIWSQTNTNNNHILTQGGNSSGSAYLRISLNPLFDDSECTITSNTAFNFPVRMGYGISISQRISGQEVFVGMLGDDGTGNTVDFTTVPQPADVSLAAATVTVATNVATVTFPANTASPFVGGDRVCVYGMTDNRLNAGPVVVTPLTYNSFSYPVTVGNATFTSTNAFVRYADPLRYAYNGSGFLWETTTATAISLVARRNGAKFRTSALTGTSTFATQSNTSAYTDAFNSGGNYEQEMRLEEMNFRTVVSDSTATANLAKFTQDIPDESPSYHLHVRARNLIGMTKPIARIVSIAKTGTTTATVTTDVPHGLSASSSWVQIYGVLDGVNFPNLTTQSQVVSAPTSTTFTVVIGTATTTSSTGGVVWAVQASVLAPGVFANNIQSITQTNGVITVIGSATWATPLPGEYVYLYGLTGGAAQQYEGGYKVLRVSTTTLELQGNNGVADFTIIATGGAAMRMTDVRVHFARALDYTRHVVEVVGGRGNTTDQNNAVPSVLTGGTVTTVTTVSAVTSANLALPGIIADQASAAITTTTTSATLIPTFGTSYQYNIAVTAATGTNETMDVQIQESRDTGTNWVPVYDFPRITATGSYNSPLLTLTGNRLRYVQTIAGTTPSFTRSINRLQDSAPGAIIRQLIDRTVNINSLNSTTPTLNSEQNTDKVQLTVNVGAITTTAPQFQVQASDDTGATWYNVGTPLTAVASTTVSSTVVDVTAQMYRVNVSTAGSGATAGYVLLRAF